MDKEQNKRPQQVIAKLRTLTDEQAKKIDSLCNDIICAHGDFVRQLGNLTFVVQTYESLLEQLDVSELLAAATGRITTAGRHCSGAVLPVDRAVFELSV